MEARMQRLLFGRRKGEILFRPVREVKLVLEGDPPPVREWISADWGQEPAATKFRTMYMGEWAVSPKQAEMINDLYGGARTSKQDLIRHNRELPSITFHEPV